MTHAPTSTRRRLASLATLAVTATLTCGTLAAPAHAATPPAAVAIAATSASPIAQDPSSTTTASGFGTAFWAYADGSVTMTSARWQVSHAQGPWTDLSTGTPSFDGTTAELDTDPTTYADNGDSYRAVFTDDQGNEYPTEAAVLTVVPKVELPDSTQGHVGAPISLTPVPEQGAPLPSGTWQRGTEDMDGLTWADTSQTGATYDLASPTTADNGVYRLHWVVDGQDFYSTYGSLYVDDSPYVSTQPAATTSVVAGNQVQLTAHLTGAANPDVQWETSATGDPNGDDWEQVDGATSETFTIAKPHLTDAGYYRATFSTDDGSWTSDVAHVLVTGAVPGVPSTVTATKVGVNSVKVTWGVPTDAGTPSTITSYGVGWSGGQFGNGTDVAGSTHEHVFTGFSAGTYTFVVKAANAAGDGAFATGVPVTIAGVTPTSGANATRRVAGQSFVLSGTGAPGTSLEVQRALPGQGWRTLDWVDVNSAGRYAKTIPVSSSATYRTRTSDGRVSAGRAVAVDNAVTMNATRKGTRRYTLSGVVSPARKGQAVKVWFRKPNGAFALLGTAYTDARGGWSYTKTFASAKTWALRAVSGDTSTNDPGSVTKNVAVR